VDQGDSSPDPLFLFLTTQVTPSEDETSGRILNINELSEQIFHNFRPPTSGFQPLFQAEIHTAQAAPAKNENRA
jgi:hypothetical protein